jgi:hypothetical protein
VLLRINGEDFLAALENAMPSQGFVGLTGTRWARTASRLPQLTDADAAPSGR